MATMGNEKLRIDIGSEFTGAKAFKKADKATAGLEKGVKRLGATLAATFTARSLVGFVKAFAEDDRAAKVLGKTLDNLGLSYGGNAKIVNDYISKLEMQTGILDDELRPAMDRLLRATSDVTQSQTLLSLALDISAGTGKSVTQVTQSLQKAYLGQTQALGRLGVGLSKAELTSSSFEEIQTRLQELFKGQGAAAADTYAGSIDKITVAGNNAKEILGKGLVEALGSAGGNNGLAGSLSGIIKLATVVSDLFVGIGRTVAALSAFFAPNLSPKQAFAEYQRVTAAFRLEDQIARRQFGGAAATKYQKEAAALAKKNLVVTTKQTAAIKEQTALQKAGSLFDITQAGIIAALKGKITDEERKRLELQLAILTGNTSEASKLAGELAKAQGLSTQLAAYLADLPKASNPFSAWASYLDMIEAQARRIAGVTPVAPMSIAGNNTSGTFSPAVQEMITSGKTVSARADAAGNVNVYVAGSVVSEADLVEAVRNGLLSNSLSGSPSAIGRLKGSFFG
jgi:hypothetical protein